MSLPSSKTPLDPGALFSPTRLLLVVEGVWDIHCLKHFSHLLRSHDAHLPDLGPLEDSGQVLFLPVGGENLGAWTARLAPLQRYEFHLFDREVSPVTEQRRRAIDVIARRPRCLATLTQKRALENYLHSDAIQEACGLTVAVDDASDIPERLARALRIAHGSTSWDTLSSRGRRRRRFRAKRWLLTALGWMTRARLMERDPHGEVIGWLTAMPDLLGEGTQPAPRAIEELPPDRNGSTHRFRHPHGFLDSLRARAPTGARVLSLVEAPSFAHSGK